jgi:hypothetical protein
MDWSGRMGEKFAFCGIDTLSETLALGCLLLLCEHVLWLEKPVIWATYSLG